MAAAVATFDNDSGGREVATGFGFCKTFARSGELAASGAYAVPEHEPAMARCSVACAPLATREDPTACETLAATLDAVWRFLHLKKMKAMPRVTGELGGSLWHAPPDLQGIART